MKEDAGAEVSDRVLTIPNLLSFLRLVLVPLFLVFLIEGDDLLALVTLAVSGITDFLDGFLARKLGQVTKLGQQLDPAADRLYILAALLGLAWRELIPWWLLVVILSRDVMLIGVAFVLARRGHGAFPVIRVGKWATAFLFIGLPVLMLGAAFPMVSGIASPIGWSFSIAGAALYWWAGVLYLLKTVRLVRGERVDSSPRSDTLDEEEVDGG